LAALEFKERRLAADGANLITVYEENRRLPHDSIELYAINLVVFSMEREVFY
jgi:hypothetical protein